MSRLQDGTHTKKICKKCIYDDRIPGIEFDINGTCNYCHQVDNLRHLYGTGTEKGRQQLDEIFQMIRLESAGKKYGCVVGVSGGTDSSFLLYLATKNNLRPLAVHYDNTWNSATATQNIHLITKALKVDLWTYVVNNKEVDDIKKAFLLAGVPEFDADTDIAFVQVLRKAAADHGIKYILEGHSFMTEGITPVSGNYLDGAYVADIHKRFGKQKTKTFPNMKFIDFMKWILIYRQKFIRPLWYIEYSKEQAREILQRETGWNYYGGHHLENRASAFAHTIWLPQRFGVDYRYLAIAAKVRKGELTRNAGLAEYQRPITVDEELINYVCKRVGFTKTEYASCMNGQRRSFRDFRTYKRRFEKLRHLFRILAQANLVPMSFYLKYCFPAKS